MGSKLIIPQQAPAVNGVRVDFDDTKFDSLINDKGLSVIWEQAIVCPCIGSEGGAALTSCKNCGGTGWVFINPVRTKMLIQSMNLSIRNNEWSKEYIGTSSITTRSNILLSNMDRVTVEGTESVYCQLVYPKYYDKRYMSFLVYSPTAVLDVFLFDRDNSKLIRLIDGDYRLDGRVFTVNSNKVKDIDNTRLSVRYKHNIQYHIIDITRENRRSFKLSDGEDQLKKFPVSAVGRRSHYVLDAPNFSGTGLLDNSYLTGDVYAGNA
jgi:hypothetical protein